MITSNICYSKLDQDAYLLGAMAAGGWMFDKNKSGHLAFDLHIHDLDMIVSIFGKPHGYSYTSTGNADKDYKEQSMTVDRLPRTGSTMSRMFLILRKPIKFLQVSMFRPRKCS